MLQCFRHERTRHGSSARERGARRLHEFVLSRARGLGGAENARRRSDKIDVRVPERVFAAREKRVARVARH